MLVSTVISKYIDKDPISRVNNMKDDIKDKIGQGIEEVKGKMKGGVDYVKGRADNQMAQKNKTGEMKSAQRGQMSMRNPPGDQEVEPEKKSKPVPKFCPYCGNSLKGLFSCGDDEKMPPADMDEGDQDSQDEDSGSEEEPQNPPQRMQGQRNPQPSQDQEEGGGDEDIQQNAKEVIERSRQGSRSSDRSDQSMQRDQQSQQKVNQDQQDQRSSKPAQKYCPYCAAPLTGSTYCPNCGNRVK